MKKKRKTAVKKIVTGLSILGIVMGNFPMDVCGQTIESVTEQRTQTQSGTEGYVTSREEAVESIRAHMRSRSTAPLEIDYHMDTAYDETGAYSDIANELWYYASDQRYGGVGDEGTYLREEVIDYMNSHISYPEEEKLEDGTYCYHMTFQFAYQRTDEEYAAYEKKIQKILSELDLEQDSDYEKLRKIYEYITTHTDYDYDGSTGEDGYTGYGLLMNGIGVCEGYSYLMSDILRRVGIDTLIFKGEKNSSARHAWNLVKLDGSYYYIDATWDGQFNYTKNFLRGIQYLTTDGHAKYVDVEARSNTLREQFGITISSVDYPCSRNESVFELSPTTEPTKPVSVPTEKPTETPMPTLTLTPTKAVTATMPPTVTVTEGATAAPVTVAPTAVVTNTPDANPATDFKYVIEDGVVTITKYIGKSSASVIVIPSTIEGYPVKTVAKETFNNCYMTKLVISEGIETLQEKAVYDCYYLKELSIPSTLNLEIPEIGCDYKNCFWNVRAVTKIEVAEDNPYLCVGADGALYTKDCKTLILYCNGLDFGGYPQFNFEENMQYMVSACMYYNQFAKGSHQGTSWSLPDGLVGIGEYALNGVMAENVVLPEGVRYLRRNCFDGASFKNVRLPSSLEEVECFGWTPYLKELSFDGNEYYKLTEEQLLYGTNKAKVNANTAIYYPRAHCGSQGYTAECTVPEGVTTIGSKCFASAAYLEKVTLAQTVTQIKADAFLIPSSGRVVSKLVIVCNPGLKNVENIVDYQSLDKSKYSVYIIFVGDSPKSTTYLPAGVTAYYPANNTTYDAFRSIKPPYYIKETGTWIAYGDKLDGTKGSFLWENEHNCRYENYCEVEIPGSSETTVTVLYQVNCSVRWKEVRNGKNVYEATVLVDGKVIKEEKQYEKNQVTHDFKINIQKAEQGKNGASCRVCTQCGYTEVVKTIAGIKSVKLSAKNFTYNGKMQKPKLTVMDANGKTMATTNYTVIYPKDPKEPGNYLVKVVFKGDYSGTVNLEYQILPKKISISNLKTVKGKKSVKTMTVTWKASKARITGYEIQYATNKKFTSAKKITVKSQKTVQKKVTGLKAKSTYYVRIRCYKSVGNKKYYSQWSTVKKVK